MRNRSDGFYEELIIAGFGGQGIILAGRLLAQTAMKAGKEVTCMPSYGAEMRGGTANSMVVISNEPIACPLVTRPDSAVIMNKASLTKFAPRIKKDGLLVYNSSVIDDKPSLDGSIEILAVEADDIAGELGNKKAANMVMLGVFLARKNLFSPNAAADALPCVLAKRYHGTLPINTEALHRGALVAEKNRQIA